MEGTGGFGVYQSRKGGAGDTRPSLSPPELPRRSSSRHPWEDPQRSPSPQPPKLRNRSSLSSGLKTFPVFTRLARPQAWMQVPAGCTNSR